ncbi:MAG: ribosome small subunit-dependent GTPase A [Candidatus Dormibacteria bacterium]
MTSTSSAYTDSLSSLGWDAAREVELLQLGLVEGRPARVARVDGAQITVLGPEPARVGSRHQAVAAGDWVWVAPPRADDGQARLAAVLSRRTAFVRESSGSQTTPQVVAANIDRVLVTCGLDVELRSARLERYLTLAWQSGAVPVVTLTKADTRSPRELAEAIRWASGIAVGAEVWAVSAATSAGVPELADSQLAAGRTVALLGPSGVGKSSLINALAGQALLQTGATRRDGKGRHTTTHGELVPLPGRGLLMDTPGLRSLGLWDASEGLAQTFSDLEALACRCRFSDCGHDREPGCAVQAAVGSGQLNPERLANWRKLERELTALAIRQGDLAARQEAQRRWKAVSRQARQARRGRR